MSAGAGSHGWKELPTPPQMVSPLERLRLELKLDRLFLAEDPRDPFTRFVVAQRGDYAVRVELPAFVDSEDYFVRALVQACKGLPQNDESPGGGIGPRTGATGRA